MRYDARVRSPVPPVGDSVAIAIRMMSIVITIFLLTAILGRVWCGWSCPQTVYMPRRAAMPEIA